MTRTVTTPDAPPRPTPTPTATAPSDEVVLVDEQGGPIGRAPRLEVHDASTPRHLAFSVHLFDDEGRVLLTRRAVSKKTWPGVWTNSCCGHPRPGEAVEDAVRRRVGEELGTAIADLAMELPDFRYRATDASGIVENEICPVFSARVRGGLRPDPAEVCEVAWVGWTDYVDSVTAIPALFSPWSVLQVPQLHARRQDHAGVTSTEETVR